MSSENEQIKELEEELEKAREEIKRLKKIEEELEEHKKAGCIFPVKGLPSFVKEDVKHVAKTPGLKKFHKGYARHIPERIDIVRALNPKKCPHCGTALSDMQEIRSRYVTDIALTMKAVNTRYDIHRKYCTTCKKLVEQPVPNVLPHARFGLNLMLFIMYLRLGLALPGNKVCELLHTLYDITISEGEIVVVLRQLTNAFGDYYVHLEKLVKLARIKSTDTTSWRINGKNYFAWVFIAAGIVLYKIRKRNNAKVGLQLFGKNQKDKILVVDRHAAFRSLAEKAGYSLQLCWAHILQDSKELAREFGAEGKYVHRKLKEIFELATGFNHQGTQEHIDQLQAEIFLLTQRHYKHSIIRRFVNTLCYRDGENLFRFVTDPNIDSTNNLSERELRKLVIIRKISNGSRSARGANATAMLLSIIQTLRFHKENILQNLHTILKNPSGC